MPPKSRQRGPPIGRAAAEATPEPVELPEPDADAAPNGRGGARRRIPPEPQQQIDFNDDSDMDNEEPMAVDEEEEDIVERDNFENGSSEEDEPMDIGDYGEGNDEDGVEVVEEEAMTIHPATIDYADVMLPDRVQIMDLGNKKSDRALLSAIKTIKHGVVTPFREVFQSRENHRIVIQKGIQRLRKTFETSNYMRHKKYDMHRYFFNELDARLSMMMEETTVHDCRLRCIKMIAVMTLEMHLDNQGEHFVPFILNYIKAWSKGPDLAGRINATCFATFMLESGLQKYEKQEAPVDTFCGWPMDIAKPLYKTLQQALLDAEPSARIPAIKGFAKLQGLPIPNGLLRDENKDNSPDGELLRDENKDNSPDGELLRDEIKDNSPDGELLSDENKDNKKKDKNNTPREWIIVACRDIDPDCRVTAISCLNLIDDDNKLVCDIIYFDIDLKVRVAAMARLAKLKPSRYVGHKLDVLDLAFKDHQAPMRDAAQCVLREWIKMLSERWHKSRAGEEAAARAGRRRGRDADVEAMEDNGEDGRSQRMKGYYLSGQALALLWISDVKETPEAHASIHNILGQLFHVLRRMYMVENAPMSSFASEIIADLRDDLIEGCIPVITKSTISSIMLESELTESHDFLTNRAQVFYWNTVIKFLADHARDPADGLNAVSRFLCPLKTMVDEFQRILISIKKEEPAENGDHMTNYLEDLYVLQMSMIENSLSALGHCQYEKAGGDAYQALLVSMLCNPFYQKKIYDIIAQELVEIYDEEKRLEIFEMFDTKVNIMTQRFRGEHFPVLDGTVLIGEAKIRNDWRMEHERTGKSYADIGRYHIDFFKVMVLNAFMKTGVLKEWTSEFDVKYTPLFRRHFQMNDNVDARVLGTECMFMVGSYRIGCVDNEIKNSFGRVRSEVEPVQAAIINGLTELCITQEAALNKLTKTVNRNEDFSQLLANLILNNRKLTNESETIFQIVQAMARILLNRKPGEDKIETQKWESNVVTMMFRASWSIQDRQGAKVRSLIIVFLKFFCSLSVRNQEMLIKGYRRFFELWDKYGQDLLPPPPKDQPPEPEAVLKAKLIARFKRYAATFVALTRHSNLMRSERDKRRPAHLKLVEDILEYIEQESAIADHYAYALAFIDWSAFSKEEQNSMYLNMQGHLEIIGDEPTSRVTELKRAYRRLAKLLGYDDNEQQDGEDMPSQATTVSRSSNSRAGPSTSSSTSRAKRNASNRSNETSTPRGRGGGRRKKELSPILDELEPIPEEIRDDDEDDEDYAMDDPNMPSTSSKPPPKIKINNRCPKGVDELLNEKPAPLRATATSTRRPPRIPPLEDPMDLMSSPTRVQKKGPSRPTTGSRRAPTPNRSTPLRTSARRLNKD